MENTKTTLQFFDVMDYEREALYLSDMHKAGWKFDHVNFPGLYHFIKCEPAEVRYQLDYNKDGIAQKEEYVQMFEDMGWEYLQDFVGYSYFRKPVTAGMEDEEIFCDDDSRWDMVKRVFRGRIIPLILLFIVCILPMFCRAISSLFTAEPRVSFLIAVIVMGIGYISIFVRFAKKYSAFKNKLDK